MSATNASSVSGRAEDATLQIICDETLRSTEVRVLFTVEIPKVRYGTPEITQRGLAAKAANDTIHQINIARRSIGETGRWMKSGWRHYPSQSGHLVLRHAAAAFIDELAEVEEFAMLTTGRTLLRL